MPKFQKRMKWNVIWDLIDGEVSFDFLLGNFLNI